MAENKDVSNFNQMQWRVNTPQLLKEILENKEDRIFSVALQIFANLLTEVGERASELNNPKLNALMCRLAIYAIADPYSKHYDEEKTKVIIRKADSQPSGINSIIEKFIMET